MSDYVITVTIPEDVAKSAEEFGLLTSDEYVEWLRKRIAEREARKWEQIQAETERIFAALDAIEPRLTEEEIETWSREARTERE